jgi:hypothetical protein
MTKKKCRPYSPEFKRRAQWKAKSNLDMYYTGNQGLVIKLQGRFGYMGNHK